MVQNSGRDPPRGVPRGVLKGGGVVQEEGDEKIKFLFSFRQHGAEMGGKKFGRSSISMPSAPFRLRTPLRGTARAPQRPIDRPEPRLGSAHGSLDLLRMGGHGGETLRHASNEQYPNAVLDSGRIMTA